MSGNNNASRKRRSSILKTKPRAPFAELEFNPPTPEASAKSRRVSFSRKTGVAEFVVNEATTTWRNFYEEQNRTLESSGNDSEIHKHAVSRSIHQQFHEVEAEIDHTTLGNPGIKSGGNVMPFSDMNFTEQFANLECLVNDNSVKPPVKNFEMSSIVQRNNTFTNSFQVPVISEHTGRIEVDFSMMQFAAQKDLEDDLSDIAKDVEQSNRSINGQNSFMQDINRSCYIEVDLNETKGLRRNDISDMSITDMIQSPKFQNFDAPQSKSANLDWIIDKENIVVESFPKPATETICQSDENILVFDGKKLKVANINDKLDDILNEPIPERKTLNRSKTSQCDSNSLSQISEDILRSQSNDIGMENVSKININLSQDTNTHQHSIHKSMSHQMSMMPDLSLVNNCIDNPSMNITSKVPEMSMIEKSLNANKSMGIELTDSNLGHVSTASLPRLTSESILDIVNTKTKLVRQKEAFCDSPPLDLEIPKVQLSEKSPILYQSKPAEPLKRKTIILNQDDDLPNFTLDIPPQFDQRSMNSFHKNFVFDTEDSMPSMSTTQAILKEIQEASGMFNNANELKKTVDDAVTNPSMTKADKPVVGSKIVKDALPDATKIVIPQNLETNTRQTIVDQYKKDHLADLSVILAVPSNPAGDGNLPLIVFDKETDNAEITATKPFLTKPIVQEKRHTGLDDINMSITNPIPPNAPVVQDLCQTIVFDKENHYGSMCVTQAIPTEPVIKQKQSIVSDKGNNDGNLSITNIIPTKPPTEKAQHLPIVFNKANCDGNMSGTHDIPSKELVELKRQTIVVDKENYERSMPVTQAISTKPIIQQTLKTKAFDKENVEETMSTTESIQTKSIVHQNRHTIIFDKENNNGNMSVTQSITTKPTEQQKHQTMAFDKKKNDGNMSITQAIPTKPIFQQKRQTIVFDRDNDDGNMSETRAIPTKEIVQQKHQTIVFDKEIDNGNMSITQAIPTKPIFQQKRQTIVFDRDNDDGNMSVTQAIPTKEIVQQIRQTVVFDRDNDDDETKMDKMSVTQGMTTKPVFQQKRHTIVFYRDNDDGNMSVTQAIPTKPIFQQKRQTIVFDYETDNGNMSITQAIPTKEIVQQKRQTIVFDRDNDDGNMSVTQAIPTKPLFQQKRHTIVFDKENDNGNMSITQAIPTKPIFQQKRQTIVFDKDNDDGNVSVTQAIPPKEIVQPKRQTIVFDKENDNGNMSITQAIRTNEFVHQKRQTIVFDRDNDDGNMSVTQAIPTKPLFQQKRQTIVFDKDNDDGNMSVTQAIPTKKIVQPNHHTIVFDRDNDDGNMSVTQAIPNSEIVQQKRQTIVFDRDNDDGNMSVTQAIPTKPLFQQKRHTIVFDKENDNGNMSITQAIPTKPIFQQKRQTNVFDKDNDDGNMSVTQAIPTKEIVQPKRQTIVFDKENDNGNMSITQAIRTNEFVQQKRQTIVFDRDNDDGNMSVTQAIPTKPLFQQKRQTIVFDRDNDDGNMSVTQAIPTKEIVQPKRQTVVFDKENDIGNMSITQAFRTNEIFQQKRQTIVFDRDNDDGNMSVTQAISTKPQFQQKHHTIVFDRDNDDGNMSVTQAIPNSEIVKKKRQTIVFDRDNDDGNMSVAQAIPNSEIVKPKCQTIVCDRDNDNENMSISQAIPSKPLFEQVKRQTIVFDKESDYGNMSITQDVPNKLGIDNNKKSQIVIYDENDDLANISITEAVASAIPNEKWRATLFEQMNEVPVTLANKPLTAVDNQDTLPRVSITQGILDKSKKNEKNTYIQNASVSVSDNVVKFISQENDNHHIHHNRNDVDKSHEPITDTIKNYDQSYHKTDISVTQAILQGKIKLNSFLGDTKPDIIISEEKNKTILSNKIEKTITNQSNPALILSDEKTTIFDSNNEILLNINIPNAILSVKKNSEKDSYLAHISLTKSLAKNKSVMCEGNSKSIYETDHHIVNVSVSQKEINTDLNLHTANSGKSTIHMQSTSGKKSFLAQMLNDESEISIEFLDGKTCDNGNSEITTSGDDIVKNQDVEGIEEDNLQTNTVLEKKEVEVDEATQAPILEESIKETDNVKKNKSHIVIKQQQTLLDNTNEIIDMLTEAAEKIEQNQITSAHKGEMFHQKKIMTEESLEIVITDLDNAKDKTHKIEYNIDHNERVEKAPKQNESSTKNGSDVSGGKETLTIAYMNQAERIMTLNATIDKRLSVDNITHKNPINLTTHNPRAKISNEVVKTLNFEDESLEKSNYMDVSNTGKNNKYKTLEQENHPSEFENDLSVTNFEPPLCSTQRFSVNSGYLHKYMSSNKAGLASVQSIAVQDDNVVVDKTYNIEKPNVKVPLIENTRDTETVSKIENSSVKNTNKSVVKEGNAGLLTKNSEEMLDNTSCITLVDDSMDTDFMEPENQNIQREKKEQINFTQTKETALENHDIHARKRLLSPRKEDLCNLNIDSTPNPPRKIHKMSNSPLSDDIHQNSLHIANKDIALKSHAHEEAGLKIDTELEKTLSGNSKFEKPIVNEEQVVISHNSDKMVLERSPQNKIEKKYMDDEISLSKNEHKNISSLINSSKHDQHLFVTQMSIISENEFKKKSDDKDFEQKSKEMQSKNHLAEKEPKLTPLKINLSKNGNEKITSPENLINNSKTDPAQVDMAESKRIPCDMHLGEISPKEKHYQNNLSKLDYHKVDTKMYLNNNKQKNICESVISEKNPKETSSQINLSKSENQKMLSQIDLNDYEENKMPTDTELCETLDVSMEEGNCKSKKMWHSFDGIEELKNQMIEEINNLHFIGTWVCKWAECTETDWCFTLLHDRIRLRVQLEASGTGYVLPETPVLTVDVMETISDNRPIASQATAACVAQLRRLATDTCARACDVSALLIRCSTVLAQTAAWARSMRHAKAHLAYNIVGDVLTLEIANVPLLSVWSLSLTITYDSTGPRANNVRVTSVCSKYQISDRAIESVLLGVEDGWDNVPQTVWKVFKYLKHKTKDDDALMFLRPK